ncbi:unnamed protein product, partial [Prorocentrum cordatum]
PDAQPDECDDDEDSSEWIQGRPGRRHRSRPPKAKAQQQTQWKTGTAPWHTWSWDTATVPPQRSQSAAPAKEPATQPAPPPLPRPAEPEVAQAHRLWLPPPNSVKELKAHRARLKESLDAIERQIHSAYEMGQTRTVISALEQDYSVILYQVMYARDAKTRVDQQKAYLDRIRKRLSDAQKHEKDLQEQAKDVKKAEELLDHFTQLEKAERDEQGSAMQVEPDGAATDATAAHQGTPANASAVAQLASMQATNIDLSEKLLALTAQMATIQAALNIQEQNGNKPAVPQHQQAASHGPGAPAAPPAVTAVGQAQLPTSWPPPPSANGGVSPVVAAARAAEEAAEPGGDNGPPAAQRRMG